MKSLLNLDFSNMKGTAVEIISNEALFQGLQTQFTIKTVSYIYFFSLKIDHLSLKFSVNYSRDKKLNFQDKNNIFLIVNPTKG